MNPTRHSSRIASVFGAAVALALFAGCSSDSPGTAPATEPSTSVAESTTTVAETTTTVAETTTTVAPTTAAPTTAAPTTAPPAPACGEGNVPSAGASSVATIVGDWNGDGVDDQATSWVEPATMDWFVMTEVTGGLSTTIAVQDPGVGFVQVVDRVDVDFSLGVDPGVNRDEFVAIVGSNAAGLNLGVFGVNAVGCGFQFIDAVDMPYIIPVHNAATTMSGMRCDGAAGSQFLVKLDARTFDGGVTWQTFDTRIRRYGDQALTEDAPIEGSLGGADPLLQDYGVAHCFGVALIDGGIDF